MTQSIGSSDISAFLDRFEHFFDGVIRSITLDYKQDGTRVMLLSIAVKDSKTHEHDGWTVVTIIVMGIIETTIHECNNSTMQVLSQGLHICSLGDTVGIEFGGSCNSPETLEELRESSGYILGKALNFEIRPYQ